MNNKQTKSEHGFIIMNKLVEVTLYHGSQQHLTVMFDGYEISNQSGEILSYPQDIVTGIVKGAAAFAWEKKALKQIVEGAISDYIICNAKLNN